MKCIDCDMDLLEVTHLMDTLAGYCFGCNRVMEAKK